MTVLETYLSKLATLGHSELLLCAGQPPCAQSAGQLTPLPGEGPVDDLALRLLVREVAGEASLVALGTRGMFDVVHTSEAGRMRCVCMQGEAGLSALLRVLPSAPESCERLGMPDAITAMARARSGLVVVTGPAGHGKTTLLAALVESINESERRLIVKVDERFELPHQNHLSAVSELRVGVHCASMAQGVRDAISMDADTIVIAELDAPGTLQAALNAALQGALVLGGVRSWGAARAIDRLLGSIPAEARGSARAALADTCIGVVAQELVPRKGGGRTAAHQLLLRSPALSAALRDNKPGALGALLQDGRPAGMQ